MHFHKKAFLFVALLSACSRPSVTPVVKAAAATLKVGATSLASRTTLAPTAAVATCTVNALVNTGKDAADALAACIANTPADGVLALSPGVFMMSRGLAITKAITITTTGLLGNVALTCGRADAHPCAELRAMPQLEANGILRPQAPNIVIDHLVINGAGPTRARSLAECSSGDGGRKRASAVNMQIGPNCTGCAFVESTSKFAPCFSGLEVVPNNNITIRNSTFSDNGVHSVAEHWSDGLTLLDLNASTITGNRLYNNTDVDLITGGAQNSLITDNQVFHSGEYESSAFTAIMIQAFAKTTSGRYDNTQIVRNSVNCGAAKGCGFGFYLGSRAWYEASRIVGPGANIDDINVLNTQSGIVVGLDVDQTIHVGRMGAGPSNGQVICQTNRGERTQYALMVESGSPAQRDAPNTYTVVAPLAIGQIPNSAPGCRPIPGVPPPAPAAPVAPAAPPAAPAGNYKQVINRLGGGVLAWLPSCGQAAVDAGRANPRLTAPDYNVLTARGLAGAPENWCPINGLLYLNSYEEADSRAGQPYDRPALICCAQ